MRITIVIVNDDNHNETKIVKKIIEKYDDVNLIIVNGLSNIKDERIKYYKSKKYFEVIEHVEDEYVYFSFLSNEINYISLIEKFKKSKREDGYFINYYKKKSDIIKNKKRNLLDNFNEKKYDNISLELTNYIFKTNILKQIKYNNNYSFDSFASITILAMQNNNSYAIINQKSNLKEPPYYEKFKKSWYIDALEVYKKIINKKTNDFVIFGLLKLIDKRFKYNQNTNNCDVLLEKDIVTFEKKMRELFSNINESSINSYYNAKNKKIFRQVIYRIINTKLQKKEKTSVLINILEYNDETINIDFECTNINKNEKDEVSLCLDNKIVDTKETFYDNKNKFFGKCYLDKKTYRANISIKDLKNVNNIYFKVNGSGSALEIEFSKFMSKLNESQSNSYWSFAGYVAKYNKKEKRIIINKTNILKNIVNEILYLYNILCSEITNFHGLKAVGLRCIYWITKPFYNKRIWITHDKLFKAGDNGEYFYNYVKNNSDCINMYYIIDKKSKDYQRLKREKGIVKYRSLRCFLVFINAEACFCTHALPYPFTGFPGVIQKYFKDRINSQNLCIQHGLSVNKIDDFQNRVFTNTKLYFCASKFEIENLLQKTYDYTQEELKLTGLPRYDGLKNNDQRTILITPTWRKYVASVNQNGKNEGKAYSNDFKDTEYFKIYKSIIESKKLEESARKNKYRILYLVHPALLNQVKDFPSDGYVDIMSPVSEVSYETLLTTSSLMVTDYSGVQFDFVYMKKPLIYFHHKNLPPHYEESTFDYKINGFGPICTTEDELIDVICEYMDNNCKMEKNYITNINYFFKYDDFDNCKRMYEESIKFLDKNK